MTDRAPGDAPESAARESAPGRPEPDRDPDWVELLQLTAGTGSDIARLMVLELRLAVTSLNRMLFLALAFLPLALLLWLGLSLMPAALVYQDTGSIALALGLFVLIQLLALAGLCLAWLRYRRALGLPRTRRQLRQFTGEERGESQPADP